MFMNRPGTLGGYNVVKNHHLTKTVAHFKSRLPSKRLAKRRIKVSVKSYRTAPSTEVIVDDNSRTMYMHPFMYDIVMKDKRIISLNCDV